MQEYGFCKSLTKHAEYIFFQESTLPLSNLFSRQLSPRRVVSPRQSRNNSAEQSSIYRVFSADWGGLYPFGGGGEPQSSVFIAAAHRAALILLAVCAPHFNLNTSRRF
jgi:hypothetical protein